MQQIDLLQAYLALPNPPVLPSGLPNVWCLRVFSTEKPFKASVLPADDSRDPNDILEATLFELAPFEMATGKPLLTGAGSSLVHVDLKRVGKRSPGPDMFKNVGQRAAIMLLRTFVATDDSVARDRLSPELLKLLPAFGTFRPRLIVTHDAAILASMFSGGFNCGSGRNHNDVSALVNRVSYPGGQSHVHDHITKTFNIKSCGMMVSCGNCDSIGTERAGHEQHKPMQKCSGCRIFF